MIAILDADAARDIVNTAWEAENIEFLQSIAEKIKYQASLKKYEIKIEVPQVSENDRKRDLLCVQNYFMAKKYEVNLFYRFIDSIATLTISWAK